MAYSQDNLTRWGGSAKVPIGVDQAFNGYIAASLIHAMEKVGLLDYLDTHSAVDIGNFTRSRGLDVRQLSGVVAAAIKCGYLAKDHEQLTLTAAGKELLEYRGYFQWLVGGYGHVLGSAAELVTGEYRYGREVSREESMVAQGTALNDRYHMAAELKSAMADLPVSKIVDLGSGNSARLCRIASGMSGTYGVGLDISRPATQLAIEKVKKTGLQDFVRPVQADVIELLNGSVKQDLIKGADTVMSFYLLHDLLARSASRAELFQRMRDSFSEARTYIFADGFLRDAAEAAAQSLPVFTLGFEMVHSLMSVPLYHREQYETWFAGAGLRVGQRIALGSPDCWLYVLHAD